MDAWSPYDHHRNNAVTGRYEDLSYGAEVLGHPKNNFYNQMNAHQLQSIVEANRESRFKEQNHNLSIINNLNERYVHEDNRQKLQAILDKKNGVERFDTVRRDRNYTGNDRMFEMRHEMDKKAKRQWEYHMRRNNQEYYREIIEPQLEVTERRRWGSRYGY